MKSKIGFTIYFLIGAAFILTEHRGAFHTGLLLKALLMPTLALVFRINREGGPSGLTRRVLAALLFSWAGDLLLHVSLRTEGYFLYGLVSFLIAQVMYLAAFAGTPGPRFLSLRKAGYWLPIPLYGALLMATLWEGLGPMKGPVLVYAAVILGMLAAAADRYRKVNRSSYALVLAGAVLFVASDSLIAVNRFATPFAGARIAIMATYITAQSLIVLGCIRQFRDNPV